MEITNSIQTPNPLTSSVRPASGSAMPMGDQSCFGILAERRTSSTPATGLFLETTAADVDVRDRKDLVAKGHVAFVAYAPGHPAWSPPVC